MFNPPHLGHLAVARQARAELGLERVLLMPVHTPPLKPAAEDPGPAHRLAMCRLLCAGEPSLEASDLEVRRGGPSWTVDTLRGIHESDPQAKLTFIVGADAARTLPAWREPAELLGLAELAVAARTGGDRARVLEAVVTAGGQAAGVRFLGMAPVGVSSSLVRERARAGEPIEGLVGDAVATYVSEHGLYHGAEAASG
jgi:nicotinate-nucleotide adenylyltransferase